MALGGEAATGALRSTYGAMNDPDLSPWEKLSEGATQSFSQAAYMIPGGGSLVAGARGAGELLGWEGLAEGAESVQERGFAPFRQTSIGVTIEDAMEGGGVDTGSGYFVEGQVREQQVEATLTGLEAQGELPIVVHDTRAA